LDELKKEIEAEKENIIKTLNGLKCAMERDEKTIVELAAISTFIHNIYNGIENLLKRILKFKGITIKKSEIWHKDLIRNSVENEIVSQEFSEKLNEYRAFRHFFIHAYGVMLDDRKLLPLAKNIPKLWDDFESEINFFIKP